MALKVIGAGLGRTGTVSLKLALEHLGFGPCYHMFEVAFAAEKTIPQWSAALRGEPDWDAIFDGFQSTTDYPGCCFWGELSVHYPDAKVLLSIRDAESWFDSISATLFSQEHWDQASKGPVRELNAYMRKDLGDRIGDRAFVIDYFNRWNQAVIDAVPADRLLVFSPKDGWEPLCAFLGVPVPKVPYPRTNSRDELHGAMASAASSPADPVTRMRGYIEQLRQDAFGPAG